MAKEAVPDYRSQKLEIQPLLAQKPKLGDEWLVFILSIILYIYYNIYRERVIILADNIKLTNQ